MAQTSKTALVHSFRFLIATQ